MAKPLVTCSDMPSMAEKMKNIAIFLVLNSLKAVRPNFSAHDCSSFFTSLHSGRVMQYRKSTMLSRPDTMNCM